MKKQQGKTDRQKVKKIYEFPSQEKSDQTLNQNCSA